MTDDSIYNEQIDRFLKGKMTTDEEIRFKAEIARNAELKQLVRNHLYLIRGIRQVKTQEEQELLKPKKPTLVVPRRRSWIRISSIAATIAAVVILSGIGGSNLYYRHEVRQYAYNTSVEVLSDFAVATRGAVSEEEMNRLTTLFSNAQEGKDLPYTIEELSKLYALTKDDYVDAEDDYVFQIGWFLITAYINNGDYNAASIILCDMSTSCSENESIMRLQKRLSKIL